MTDEQLNNIVEALKQSSFKDDFWVAITTGIILLITSTLITYLISRMQSNKVKQEMIMRINTEAKANLIISRNLMLDEIKFKEFASINERVYDVVQNIEDVYNLVNDMFYDTGITRFLAEDGLGRYEILQKYQTSINSLIDLIARSEFYFNEKDYSKIMESFDEINNGFSILIQNGEYDEFKNFEKNFLTENIGVIVSIIDDIRKSLYQKLNENYFI